MKRAQPSSILTIGDGNLSYSLSLISSIPGLSVTATTYDSLDELRAKYTAHKIDETISKICAHSGSRVLHGVDARKLEASVNGSCLFDRIVFMHPLVPNWETAEFVKANGRDFATLLINRHMLVTFLESASGFLTQDGEIHITIKNVHPYTVWRVGKLARWVPCLESLGKEDFDASVAALYESRNVERDTPFPLTQSVTYIFRKRKNPIAPPPPRKDLFCDVCDSLFTSAKDQALHQASKAHKKTSNIEKAWLDYTIKLGIGSTD